MGKNETHDDEIIDHAEGDHEEVIVDEDSMQLDSFKKYPSSDDDNTKIVDGEKVVESFHLYKEETDMDQE